MERDYRVQVPYLEAIRGQETKRQAIRIRQLYADFDADYIVLDARNLGISIYRNVRRCTIDRKAKAAALSAAKIGRIQGALSRFLGITAVAA